MKSTPEERIEFWVVVIATILIVASIVARARGQDVPVIPRVADVSVGERDGRGGLLRAGTARGPVEPTMPAAVVGMGRVFVNWTAPTNELSSYQLWQGVVKGLYTNTVFVAAPTNRAEMVRVMGVTNWYAVIAYDTRGFPSVWAETSFFTNGVVGPPVTNVTLSARWEGTTNGLTWYVVPGPVATVTLSNRLAAEWYRVKGAITK